MATKQSSKKVTEQSIEPQSTQEPFQGTWICDHLEVFNANVSPTGITLDVRFVSFFGTLITIQVSREDCFADFSKVLRTLVRNGFRYNTMLPQAPTLIQYQLTSFQPNLESVKRAIAEFRQSQKASLEKAKTKTQEVDA